MSALTLQWYDAGQYKTYQISQNNNSKNPGTIRIGRDPLRCDILLSDLTVSGLHIEIFFHPQQQSFFIRNLREQNPPLVNAKQLLQGELPLNEGNIIYLGKMELKVIAVDISASSNIPATILSPPTPPPQPQPIYQHSPTPPVQLQKVYGLECPKCHRVSPYEHQHLPCCWCGTSLAAAMSVLVTPGS